MHVHDKQGSVYGFRSELDGWRARASHLAPTAEPAEKRRTPRRLAVAAVSPIAVGAILIVPCASSGAKTRVRGRTHQIYSSARAI
jgi:hypothetical protein